MTTGRNGVVHETELGSEEGMKVVEPGSDKGEKERQEKKDQSKDDIDQGKEETDQAKKEIDGSKEETDRSKEEMFQREVFFQQDGSTKMFNIFEVFADNKISGEWS